MINKHLSAQRKAEHSKIEEMPIMADTVKLNVDESYRPKICEMIHREECLWDERMVRLRFLNTLSTYSRTHTSVQLGPVSS